MQQINSALLNINWPEIKAGLNAKGYAVIKKLIPAHWCDELRGNYSSSAIYRKTVVMERYRFGSGEYKYFTYPLPEILQSLRENMYPHLSILANEWMENLNISKKYPLLHNDFILECHQSGQTLPTPLILKYGAGGFNTLHQDLYGETFFPLQAVIMLTEPDHDFTGGEFILVQQTPRAQSKAIVVRPQKGDVIIFPTNFRPIRGSKGYYRVVMKHGVSEVTGGERVTSGIIFHDATS